MDALLYTFIMTNLQGKEIKLSEYKDKVIMIVNVASKCGFTPQYKQLEEVYLKYKDKGLIILGFPANDFLSQEPGTDADIQNFCSLTYGVTFPVFSKIHVKGKDTHPLYQYLTDKKQNPQTGGNITWNFNKFLINKQGIPVYRFDSPEKPDSEKITAAIEKLLAE